MRLKSLIALALFAASTLITSGAQTTSRAHTSTKSAQTTARNSPEQLPFADARNMTVILLWVPPGPQSMQGSTSAAGGIPVPSGSGVWIGKKGYIATCRHVIPASAGTVKIGIARDPYVSEGTLNISITGAATVIGADLVASDADTDVAILKTPKAPDQIQIPQLVSGNVPPSITPQSPISPKGARIKNQFPQLGELLLLAGFPLNENTLVLQTGTATGFLSNPQAPTSPPASSLRIVLSLVSNPGNSGGPVFDVHGNVVALLEGNLAYPISDRDRRDVYGLRQRLDPATGQPMRDASGQPLFEPTQSLQNSGISLAIPAKFIADLAKKNNINLD